MNTPLKLATCLIFPLALALLPGCKSASKGAQSSSAASSSAMGMKSPGLLPVPTRSKTMATPMTAQDAYKQIAAHLADLDAQLKGGQITQAQHDAQAKAVVDNYTANIAK